jgi:hypothetical protein
MDSQLEKVHLLLMDARDSHPMVFILTTAKGEPKDQIL